jgi:hypothetical protein
MVDVTRELSMTYVPVNWGSIVSGIANLGAPKLTEEAAGHAADAERRRKEELRYMEEMDRKRAELAKAIRQKDST